ncbi:hypothetical protein Gorai_021824 [Gossypium raimondii]|uniref:Endonuclease/exonuclease/phosphatase domain-containing protein n=1 Tax=Gossypium raimondii TaxID=29730 RepID=A0A7J8NRF7_GOSRA|nr:hypothetical protein [Gossypium raimondii]
MRLFFWNCRGLENPAIVCELKQLLVSTNSDVIFLYETKLHSNSLQRIHNICRMEGCLAVSSEGCREGLAMLWKEGVEVSIQNYTNHHIDSLEGGRYDQEGMGSGGNFNAIINDADKEGGQRKLRVIMDDFCEVMEELSLVDIKTNNGWFTWVNNREMMNMVTERLDMILVLNDSIGNMSYLVTKVVRQSKLDHDKILMDTMGSKPCENFKDPKLLFKYDGCWAKDKEAREIINRI